jgi:hypothetical protein
MAGRAECRTACQQRLPLLRRNRWQEAADLGGGPLVDPLGDVGQIIRSRVRANQEVDGAQCCSVVLIEDIVPALDRKERSDEDPCAGVRELGNIPPTQRQRAVPGVGKLLVIGNEIADLAIPPGAGSGQGESDGSCLLVAAGEQQHSAASGLESIAVSFEQALAVLAGSYKAADQRS